MAFTPGPSLAPTVSPSTAGSNMHTRTTQCRDKSRLLINQLAEM
eukprot:gene10924-biopygen7804